MEGHKHCNYEIENNTGYLLGAFGFEDGDSSCAGAFGIPVLDTRHGYARLYYFKMGEHGHRLPNWDTIMNCFKDQGYSNCLQYAEVWMEEKLNSRQRQRSLPSEIPKSRPACHFTVKMGSSIHYKFYANVTGHRGDRFHYEGCDELGRNKLRNQWDQVVGYVGRCNETSRIISSLQYCDDSTTEHHHYRTVVIDDQIEV